MADKNLSVQRACAAVGLSRAAWYKTPQDRLVRDAEVIDALQGLAEKYPRRSFWKYHCNDGLVDTGPAVRPVPVEALASVNLNLSHLG